MDDNVLVKYLSAEPWGKTYKVMLDKDYGYSTIYIPKSQIVNNNIVTKTLQVSAWIWERKLEEIDKCETNLIRKKDWNE